MDQKIYEIPKFRPPKISPSMVGGLVALALLVAAAFSSVYKIDPQEVGVVVRFGKYRYETKPGLHFKLPFIDDVTPVPVQRQLKQEFGFRTLEANIRSRYSRVADEATMLTADLNVAMVEWIVQYRVTDPYQYLYKVRQLTDTFRAMNEAVVRGVVGDHMVTEVLTVGREQIEGLVRQQLQGLCEQYKMGITIEKIVLQDVNPPDSVKPSWDEVNRAQQQRDRLINEAQKEFNEEIPRAKGEAQQAVLQSKGYATNRVNRAEGDAARFVSLVNEYRRAPDVTRRRMYLETISKVLPKVGGKLLLDDGAKGVLPLLPLNNFRQLQNVPKNPPGGQQ